MTEISERRKEYRSRNREHNRRALANCNALYWRPDSDPEAAGWHAAWMKDGRAYEHSGSRQSSQMPDKWKYATLDEIVEATQDWIYSHKCAGGCDVCDRAPWKSAV